MISAEDLAVLCCPTCHGSLVLDKERLRCTSCGTDFAIIDNIPRLFAPDDHYNLSWDYKWTILDGGQAFNYQHIEPGSPAYETPNIFRFFEDEKDLFANAKTAIDIGCGSGQYSVALLQQGLPKVYALDRTRGVDVGREIISRKYPQYLDRIIFVQGDARKLPFKTGSIDLVMALGSIHHSGALEKCIEEAHRITKPGHRFFIWIYAKPLMPYGDEYRNMKGWIKRLVMTLYLSYADLIHMFIKNVPDKVRVPILKVMASDTIYALQSNRHLERFVKHLIPGINDHPQKGYRLINLYDAYSPTFVAHSDESDVIQWSKRLGFKILNFMPWRLGFVAEKAPLDKP